MDISQIQAKKKTFEILHPETDEPIGLRWTLLPDTDPKVKKVVRQNQDRQFAKRKIKLSSSQLEQNALDQLVAATDSWEWYDDATFEGEVPEFNEENVRRVLLKVPAIKEQVLDEFNDRESFYKG
jgi:hypothetical protein